MSAMTCEGCSTAAAWPLSGLYIRGCRECSARALANGPLFHAVERSPGPHRGAYRGLLHAIWGDDWRAGHEAVKRWAERIERCRHSDGQVAGP